MKILLDIVLMAAAVLYQATLSAKLQVQGVGIDLLLILLCSIAILQGPAVGAVCGLISGAILDAMFGHMGFYSAAYLGCGMLIGYLAERMRFDQWVFPLIAFALMFVLKECYALVYIFFCDVAISWGGAFLKVLLGAGVSGVVFIGVHFLLERLHRWEVIRAPLFRPGRW